MYLHITETPFYVTHGLQENSELCHRNSSCNCKLLPTHSAVIWRPANLACVPSLCSGQRVHKIHVFKALIYHNFQVLTGLSKVVHILTNAIQKQQNHHILEQEKENSISVGPRPGRASSCMAYSCSMVRGPKGCSMLPCLQRRETTGQARLCLTRKVYFTSCLYTQCPLGTINLLLYMVFLPLPASFGIPRVSSW